MDTRHVQQAAPDWGDPEGLVTSQGLGGEGMG